ncbi:MAG TPA: MC/SLC25 family protein [Gammaproteobacteria bacterium]|nr:MC/SLC25 family protein [Gammaproteobacteria bacterium]
MPQNNTETSKPPLSTLSVEDYAKVSSLGAARGLTGLTIEHPFDYVKTRMQASGGQQSVRQVVYGTYKQYGLRGFYAGAIPNATRVAVKQAYRYPMMIGLPHFYQSTLWKGNENSVASKALTSLTIASFECLILTPLEKFKVVLMTNKEKNIRSIWAEANHSMKLFMRDINIVYPRQIVAWGTYMIPEEILKNAVRSRQQSKDLSPQTLLGISVAVGVINTAATMPIDAVKTLVQKDPPWPNEGLAKTFTTAYKTYGMKGLYAGWQVRSAQYVVQSFLTANLIEKLERNVRDRMKPA